MKKLILLLAILALALPARPGWCLDEIRIQAGASSADQRNNYPIAVLTRVMEVTEDSDGPFVISHPRHWMVRKRALNELIKGERINVQVAAARQEWEDQLLPVRIPVLKGLLGYRLFLVNAKDLGKFEGLHDLNILKRMVAGSGEQWTITAAMKAGGFRVVTGTCYEGLFAMLDMDRFDYFSRGVNEIFAEYEERKGRYPNLRIEPSLALYCPAPSYFFVSPQYPHLADRIRRGMEILVKSGELDAMFHKRFDRDIERAGLNSRTILRIGNPLLSDKTPLDRPELWFRPEKQP